MRDSKMPVPDFHPALLNLFSTKPKPESWAFSSTLFAKHEDKERKTIQRMTSSKARQKTGEKAWETVVSNLTKRFRYPEMRKADFNREVDELAAREYPSEWQRLLAGLRIHLTSEIFDELLPQTIRRIERFDKARLILKAESSGQELLEALQQAYDVPPSPILTICDLLKSKPSGHEVMLAGCFSGLYGMAAIIFDIIADCQRVSEIDLIEVVSAQTPTISWLEAVEHEAFSSERSSPKDWLIKALADTENLEFVQHDTKASLRAKVRKIRNQEHEQRLSYSDVTVILKYLLELQYISEEKKINFHCLYASAVYVENLQITMNHMDKAFSPRAVSYTHLTLPTTPYV